jgi:hypothetical protein
MTPMKARVLAVGLALLAWVGCTLTKTDLRRQADDLLPALGPGGQLIVPRQCALKMAVVARPVGDPALGEILWQVADAQAVGDEARRTLEANGLRVGLISGELPPEVRAILDAPPPNQVSPAVVILPDNDSTRVDLSAASDELDLLLARDGGVSGKRYKDAHGFLRLSPWRQGEDGVAVKITPELHHGPVRQGWGAAPSSSAFTPQQMVVRNGQQEETFRDLAATLTLRAGRVAVVAATPGTRGSLGSFLFTAPEANSDRMVQKVLFLWASRSEDGSAGDPLPPGLQPLDPADLDGAPARRASAAARGEARKADPD